MPTKTAKKICCKKHMENWDYVRCKAPVTVTRNGNDYCHHHDPERREVQRADALTVFAVTADSWDDGPLNVTKAQVIPHGAKEFKIIAAVEMNPKAYAFNEETTRPSAFGCKTIIPRDLVSPTLKGAFHKYLQESAQKVEVARVKADEEVIRHEQEQIRVGAMIMEMEVT